MNDCSVPMCGESGLCGSCRRKQELRSMRSNVKHHFGATPPSAPAPKGVTTVCPKCGDMFTPAMGTLATCRLGCAATPTIVLATPNATTPEPHHGPHERALVLSVTDRQALQDFVSGGGYQLLKRVGRSQAATGENEIALGLVELLLKIAKRVLLFQSHAEEAVIAYDHREQAIGNLRFRAEGQTSEFLTNELCKAWYAAGGRLEAIENGVDTVDLDWRRDVWRIVGEVAHAITQPTLVGRQNVEGAFKFAINEHELRRMIHDEEIAWRTMIAMLENALNAPAKPSMQVVVGRSKPTKPITATCAQCTAGRVSRSDGVGGKWDELCEQCGGRGTVEVIL